jgi:methionine-rich copper-binding protein CopC
VSRLAAALLAGALALAPAGAPAHSLLLGSEPATGAAVSAPARLALRFNNRIEKPLSRVRVLGAGGAAQPLAVLVGEGAPDRLVAALPPLAPGVWRVEWQVLSTDGHIVRGSFSFRVAP